MCVTVCVWPESLPGSAQQSVLQLHQGVGYQPAADDVLRQVECNPRYWLAMPYSDPPASRGTQYKHNTHIIQGLSHARVCVRACICGSLFLRLVQGTRKQNTGPGQLSVAVCVCVCHTRTDCAADVMSRN